MPRASANAAEVAVAPDLDAGRARRALAPFALVLVLGCVYLGTLLPGPGHSHDSAEMQFVVPLLGVPHATGYPTYVLLAHAFCRLVPVGTVAYRLNLLSAIYGVLACLVLFRLLRRLGVREVAAWAASVAFGLTPTFWRFAVVTEVYGLNLLFVALVSERLLAWRQSRRDRDLLLACAAYVVSFGNHLTMATLLPAFVFLVLATQWRVLVRPRLVLSVGALILLGLVPYAYPLVRSLDPNTAYLAHSVTSFSELVGYATGSAFRGDMFAFGWSQLLTERVPSFARLLWRDCAPFLPFALIGACSLRDRVTAGYLVLTFLGHLGFALGYDIGDIDNYFIPCYLVVAVFAAVGLEAALRSPAGRRVPAWVVFVLPLLLVPLNRGEVGRMKRPELAVPMRELLDEVRGGALIVATYNDYMQLLYLSLIERVGGPHVFLGCEVAPEDLAAYVRGRPLYLKPLRKHAPPGLPVYSTRLDQRPRLRALGLGVRMVRPGVYRIWPTGAAAPPAP